MPKKMIKISMSGGFGSLNQLAKSWGGIRAAFMSYIGSQGRIALKMRFLSGQVLKLKSDKDIKGKYTTSSSVGKKANSVSISSYPLNLYEGGNSRINWAAVNVFSVKLKSLAESQLQKWSNEGEKKIISGAFAKV
jgi:hypothetical protein